MRKLTSSIPSWGKGELDNKEQAEFASEESGAEWEAAARYDL